MEGNAHRIASRLGSDEADVLLVIGSKRKIALLTLKGVVPRLVESWRDWSTDVRSYGDRVRASVDILEHHGLVRVREGIVEITNLGLEAFIALKDRMRALGKL